MEKLFKVSFKKVNLEAQGTDLGTELIAGITTFLAMSYILAVNPNILSASGMDTGAVFTATALSAAVATLVMGLVANLPFGLAPGMGLNAFLTYTVCMGMGYTWQFALTAILCEGIIFILLTACNVREAIVNAIPANLKKAISAGIGFFIAFIGLQNAGIVVNDDSTLVSLNISSNTALVCIIGLVITSILIARGVKGAFLIGILASTFIGIAFDVTHFTGFVSLPPSLAPTFCKFSFDEVLAHPGDFLIVMFTFLFVDMFDTVGTLIGCAEKAGMIGKDEKLPHCKEALFADAVGTTVGAILGTSTVTTFVESATGVASGGRTGVTALSTAGMFILSLFFSPLFLSVPSAATAPALILVGFYMISSVKEIDFSDATEGIPCFLCMLIMVCAYSISDGIMFGVVSYVAIKFCTGKVSDLTPMTVVLAVLFGIKVFVNLL